MKLNLVRLVRRDASKPNLRERLAGLKATAARVIRREVAPAPTNDAAADADLLRLARKWERAREEYDASLEQLHVICAAAGQGPGESPHDGGPAFRRWLAETTEWRASTGIEAAEEESGDLCRALGEIEDQICAATARTMAGLQAKAQVIRYNEEIGVTLPDGLAEGLARDLLAMDEPAEREPATAADFAALAFEAYAFDEPVRSPPQWLDKIRPHTLGLHLADRLLRMSKAETVAFLADAETRLPAGSKSMLDVLEAAQESLDGWARLLGVAQARFMVSAAVLAAREEAAQG